MSISRHQKIFLQKQKILEVTERLLLDNNQDIVVGELAQALDIAKGTIYKYFKSKNQLYLELLIVNEQRLLDIAKSYQDNFEKSITTYILYHLENANRTILFHTIEERIANKEKSLKHKFEQLYAIREQRIAEVKDITINFLKSCGISIPLRDYLSYVWSITYGACLLLNSTYYQKSVGGRADLINFYIKQALYIKD